jgi:hypothetical protein
MRIAVFFICLGILASYACAYSGGTGEPNSPYLISTPADWLLLCNTPADANGKSFLLTTDMYMLGNSAGDIGSFGQPFTGTFDGGGHTLSWLQFTGTHMYSGPFGWIGGGGVVKNLNLSNVSVTSTGSNGYYAGGLVGYNQGTVRNCSVSGATLSPGYPGNTAGLVGGNSGLVIDCSFTGNMTLSGLGGNAAGLVAYNWGTILYSRAQGNITASVASGGVLVGDSSGVIRNCYSTGSMTNYGNVCGGEAGGLIGVNAGKISSSYSTADAHAWGTSKYDTWAGGLVGTNCLGCTISDSYATGNAYGHVTGSTAKAIVGGFVGVCGTGIVHCYSTGTARAIGSFLSPSQKVLGGFAGQDSGTAADCFWDVNSSGQPTSAAGTGITTVQMKTYSTFASAGWDFTDETANDVNDIWLKFTNGADYPRLAWQTAGNGNFVSPGSVGPEDMAYMADRWLRSSCPNAPWCDATDMDHSGRVDFRDFALFSRHLAGSM